MQNCAKKTFAHIPRKTHVSPTCVVGDSPVGDFSQWHLTPYHSVEVEASESKDGPPSPARVWAHMNL